MLNPSERLPRTVLQVLGSSAITLPDDVTDSWAYVVFYRGHW